MAIRKILQFPNPKLKLKSTPADLSSPDTIQAAQDILDTMANTENAAGLAAPQIDIQLRIVGMRTDQEAPLICINPTLSDLSAEKETDIEACLSVDGAVYNAAVERHRSVTLTAYNMQLEKFSVQLEGFYARCIQHEIDHLDGVLFIDYLSRLKRERLKKHISKQKTLTN